MQDESQTPIPVELADAVAPADPQAYTSPSSEPLAGSANPDSAPAQEVAAAVAPTLATFVAQILGAVRGVEADCNGRVKLREDANLSRAQAFLHEAGQWLEKAALNLKAAGI